MNEKAAFSQRLIQALQRMRVNPITPTRIANAFNLLHQGESVSVQAVHKWLNGGAVPGQDKIRTLATWLGVTPEWLRYGETVQAKADKRGRTMQELPPYKVTEELLAEAFARLSDEHKKVVCGVVATLLNIEAEQR